MKMIASDRLTEFSAAYPGGAAPVSHNLQDHPLFALDALADLAARLPDSHVEHSRGDLAVDQNPDAITRVALTPAEIVRTIADNGCWMVLKKVDVDPAYAALIDACLAEIDGVVTPATGAYLRREAFIFLSAPNSVTPFHMDPEHNILLQIDGQKTMHVYPADDWSIVPPESHETFHQGGRHRNMRHDPAFDAKARAFAMRAGDAVYVPVKAPHWVQNGPEPSISFSITWRSTLSDREARLHRFNAGLRKLGLTPGVPGTAPALDEAKVVAHHTIKRITTLARKVVGKGARALGVLRRSGPRGVYCIDNTALLRDGVFRHRVLHDPSIASFVPMRVDHGRVGRNRCTTARLPAVVSSRPA